MPRPPPDACPPVGSLRLAPPARPINSLPAKNTRHPAISPNTTRPPPPARSYDSCTSSNATALISTPDPNAMMSPIHTRLIRNHSAIHAPISNEDAASAPQANDPPPDTASISRPSDPFDLGHRPECMIRDSFLLGDGLSTLLWFCRRRCVDGSQCCGIASSACS